MAAGVNVFIFDDRVLGSDSSVIVDKSPQLVTDLVKLTHWRSKRGADSPTLWLLGAQIAGSYGRLDNPNITILTAFGTRREIPPTGRAAPRAAAVWRLGGVRRAAYAFGLSVRRTLSGLAGRGHRSREERIEQVIYASGVGVGLLVRVRFDTLTGGLQAEADREVETILDVEERDVETLDDLVRSGDTVSALQILQPLIDKQYMREVVDASVTEIPMPGPDLRSQVQYVLTPQGVIGPGYAS